MADTEVLPLSAEDHQGAREHHHRDADDGSAEAGSAQRLDARHAAAGDRQPRRVGRAFTLRFVPAREDLATPASWGAPISTRAAIEAMPEGVIAVADAMGVTDAGIFGDILWPHAQAQRRSRSSAMA